MSTKILNSCTTEISTQPSTSTKLIHNSCTTARVSQNACTTEESTQPRL